MRAGCARSWWACDGGRGEASKPSTPKNSLSNLLTYFLRKPSESRNESLSGTQAKALRGSKRRPVGSNSRDNPKKASRNSATERRCGGVDETFSLQSLTNLNHGQDTRENRTRQTTRSSTQPHAKPRRTSRPHAHTPTHLPPHHLRLSHPHARAQPPGEPSPARSPPTSPQAPPPEKELLTTEQHEKKRQTGEGKPAVALYTFSAGAAGASS